MCLKFILCTVDSHLVTLFFLLSYSSYLNKLICILLIAIKCAYIWNRIYKNETISILTPGGAWSGGETWQRFTLEWDRKGSGQTKEFVCAGIAIEGFFFKIFYYENILKHLKKLEMNTVYPSPKFNTWSRLLYLFLSFKTKNSHIYLYKEHCIYTRI